MKLELYLNEIRAAMATLSAVHAGGDMTRADINAAVSFIEERCDEIAALAAGTGTGTVQLAIMRLCDVAAEMRAEDAARRARPALAVVPNEGDAA